MLNHNGERANWHIELSDGRLIHPDAVADFRPNNGMWRLSWMWTGRTEDFGGENAEAIRDALRHPEPKKQGRKTQK